MAPKSNARYSGDEVVALTKKGRERLVKQKKELQARLREKDIQIARLEIGTTESANQERARQIWDLLGERGPIALQLQRTEEKLNRSVTIPDRRRHSVVTSGSKVTVKIIAGCWPGKTLTYTIAGLGDPKAGMIGEKSPLAAALLGHSRGEVVDYFVGQTANRVQVLGIQ